MSGAALPDVPSWLSKTVMYEIYPQSFADSDGDGVGDLAGITARLDYLAWLGVDSVWLNPCFTSPFRDAGYDVADFCSIAPRYGRNEDLAGLADQAARRGIRILLDLVAGHTSDQHPWFLAAIDDPDDGRYIFAGPGTAAGAPGPVWVRSPGRRPGWYLPNFYPFQPALNYGYARPDPAEPWRQDVDAPGPRANRAALAEIMAHWLDLGVAGFRVDLASTLVKDDPGWAATGRLWRELSGWLRRGYPDAVLMSEWNKPAVSIPAGFHADFYLAIGPEHRSLLDNGAGQVRPAGSVRPGGMSGPSDSAAGAQPSDSAAATRPSDSAAARCAPAGPACYFDLAGAGSAEAFLAAWRRDSATAGDRGVIAMFSSDHDFNRPACGPRTADQLGPVFAFLLTWPSLPGIHCGDEIGMRQLPGLPDVEGSQIWPGWNRAGSRTPVQWDDGPNAGFSAAPADRLYLPVDPDPGRPTVAAQRADESSLLHLVRRLIGIRKTIPALATGGAAQVLNAGYPLVYLRGDTHLVVINPRRDQATFALPGSVPGAPAPVLAHGVTVTGGRIAADGLSFGIFELQ